MKDTSKYLNVHLDQTGAIPESQCGLTLSTKKTEVVYQPAAGTGKPYSELSITVNVQKLQVADKFNYLGSNLSRGVHIDNEVTARTATARVAFGTFRGNVWERNGSDT